MEIPSTYIPMDRRQALLAGMSLPDRTRGAALFADISGFTPLTEALLNQLGPKLGADELTRQLNRVYDALITEVHRYRGSVITFSGDAITCWFDQDEGLRATACGLAMQQVMQRFAQVKTPSGSTVSLGMKAAVATGPVRRFLIGDPAIQRLDALAGHTLALMAGAEHLAERGEVVLDANPAHRLAQAVDVAVWRTDPDTGQQVAVVSSLRRAVDASPWPDLTAQSLDDAQLRSWLLPPIYDRLKAGQGRFLAELRPAVALFLKFEGINYDEDDAAGDKLDAYIRWVQKTLARYDSYLFQLTIGDKGSYLYAAFGAPVALTDAALEAVAAALDLRSLPPTITDISQPQIGLSQGRMYAGAYGGSMRRTYGVLGDDVNLAARLMGKAAPGQILVSEQIAKSGDKVFRFDALGPIKVKGKQAPLPVYRVADQYVPSSQDVTALFRTPLVGRDGELAQMMQILAPVLDAGKGQILRIEGAAGLGKSHLAAEFARQAATQGVSVLVGACQTIGQDTPYFPWQQILRPLLDLPDAPPDTSPETHAAQAIAQLETTINQLNPDWLLRLPLLGDILDLPIPDNTTTAAFDPQLRRESLFALVIDLILFQAAHQPIMLLIEDAHWLDEVSRELVLAVSRAIAAAPVMLCLVHRPAPDTEHPLFPELAHLPNHHHLALRELTPEGVAALAANRLQKHLSRLALALIEAQAQGNPFFVEELIDNLRESGSLEPGPGDVWTLSESLFQALQAANCLTKEDDDWTLAADASLSAADLGIPDSIHGIVLSRLDRLPEANKLTLKAASVIGRIFAMDLLARSHPLQPDEALILSQMKTLIEREFTHLEKPLPQLAYMFKHNITQESAYDTLLSAQRRELHQAVAEALEDLDPEAVEQLAYHYGRSGQREKTLFYLDKAADKAQREYANETALAYYNQALALEERWSWRKGQIETLHILGRREMEAEGLKVLAATPDAPAFDVAYLWGQYYEAMGDYTQATEAIERALAVCRQQADLAAEARCLAQLGLIARRQGDYEQATTHYHHALTVLNTETLSAEDMTQPIIETLNGLGIVLRQQGDFEQATSHYRRALKLSRRNGNRKSEAEALNSLGATAHYQRHVAEAVEHYRQALEIRRAIGDRAGEGTSLFNLALVTSEAGDYGHSEDYFLKALAIQRATGNRWEEANILNSLGFLHQELGDLTTANDYLQQSLALSREIGDEVGQTYVLGNLGLVARDRGDLPAAETLFEDGLALARKQADRYVESIFMSHLAIVSLMMERFEQAIERAEDTLALRRELDLRLWTTADLSTLAQAHLAEGRPREALDYARQALVLLDECGGEGPEFPHRDYFVCSQVLAATGHDEQAHLALDAAYKLVMRRAKNINDAALRRSFLEQVPINRQIIAAAAPRQALDT